MSSAMQLLKATEAEMKSMELKLIPTVNATVKYTSLNLLLQPAQKKLA